MFSEAGLFAFIFTLFAMGANFLEKKLRNAFLLNPIVILTTNCTAVVNRFQTAILVFTPPSVLHSSPLGKNCLDSQRRQAGVYFLSPLHATDLLSIPPFFFSHHKSRVIQGLEYKEKAPFMSQPATARNSVAEGCCIHTDLYGTNIYKALFIIPGSSNFNVENTMSH